MTALLIAVQFSLSMVQGVEVVTVLFLSYCAVFGVRSGLIVANAFSLLRCLLFGFFPAVIVLYLIYYNIFAVVFGMLGKSVYKLPPVKRVVMVTVAAVIMSAVFTLLDDIITPLMLGYGAQMAKIYFYNSLIVMGVQAACSAVTVSLLFLPLTKVFDMVKR